MAVKLATQKKDNSLNLVQIDRTKLAHFNRVRSDLDKFFIENETKNESTNLGLNYVDLYGFPIDTAHLVLLSKSDSEKLKMGVFSVHADEIHIATPEPGYKGQTEKLQEFKKQGYKIKIYLCSELSFQKILDTYNFLIEVKTIDDSIIITDLMVETFSKDFNLGNFQEQIKTISTSKLIEIILIVAINNKATDIHFEPEKDGYHLRFRLDGVLHTFAVLTSDYVKILESRIKIISHLKLNVNNIPQDGRFSFRIKERDIDVRVSMLPSNYGYSIVMRLLGTDNVVLELEQLGFIGLSKQRILTSVNKPQGMVLTTGPTGSGKTTTLYTFLKDLNDGESKIITLEDPIEYKLAGISQTQIDSQGGYTFASGLRSILRQDPDVVMIGEIRDRETADTAVQAALTGHLVLSTIHTNDASGCIPRLMEMGIKGFLLADSLNAVIGQRLVRKICPYCKVVDHLNPEQKELVIRNLKNLPEVANIELPSKIKFFTSKGCEKCNNIGYKGRIGAYEVMTMTDGLRENISTQFPSIVQVRKIAQKEGMLTMMQDAILKALDGITNIKEIMENIV